MRKIFKILLIFQFPFWCGYGYIYLNVHKSVIERKIHIASLKQAELKKRNAALKKEIYYLSKNTRANAGVDVINLTNSNKIIHLDLPALPPKNP